MSLSTAIALNVYSRQEGYKESEQLIDTTGMYAFLYLWVPRATSGPPRPLHTNRAVLFL